MTAIKERELRRAHVRAELRALNAPLSVHGPDGVTAEALHHLDEWRGLLGQNTSLSRQLLRKVLEGRLAFIPRRDGTDRWYVRIRGRSHARQVL